MNVYLDVVYAAHHCGLGRGAHRPMGAAFGLGVEHRVEQFGNPFVIVGAQPARHGGFGQSGHTGGHIPLAPVGHRLVLDPHSAGNGRIGRLAYE